MVLERYRASFQGALTPVARAALSAGLTPNVVTTISLLFAVAAGASYAVATPDRAWLLVAGGLLAGANAFADGIDGRMARISGRETKRGDYLDHVLDRYADVALLLGLTLSVFGSLLIGLFAIVGTLLTSYMGTQSQALGLGRDYRGILGRADRTVLVAAVPGLEGIRILLGVEWAYPWTWTVIVLAYVAVAGNLTALQRFARGWKELGAK